MDQTLIVEYCNHCVFMIMVYIGIISLTLFINHSSSAFQPSTQVNGRARIRLENSELQSSPDNVMDAFDLALAQMSKGSNARSEGALISEQKSNSVGTLVSEKQKGIAASITAQTKSVQKKQTKVQMGPVQFPLTDSLFKTLTADSPQKASSSGNWKSAAPSPSTLSSTSSAVTTSNQSGKSSTAATTTTKTGRRFSEEDAVMAAYGKALNTAIGDELGKTSGQIPSYKVSVSSQQKTMETSVTTPSTPSKYTAAQGFATLQSTIVGAIAGVVAVAPFTSLHHFYFYPYPDYTGLAQWEWDTVTAAIQGAVYSAVYRYSLREDVDEDKIRDGVFTAFVLVRTLVRLQVPSYCAALPLQCGEPLEYLDWSMIGELAMSYVESVALFGVVGAIMDWLLREKFIKPFPNE
jgi:hypothetical protein